MNWRSLPAATKILSGVALLHNFCFWGLASIFPLYATSRLGFSQERAMSWYGLMLGLAFAMPALGGFAVSRLRSAAAPQRRVRIAQAALLCLCSGSLLFLVGSPNFTLVGAVLLTLGYGLFWPTVVTMVSDAYNVGESSTSTKSKRDDGFVIFYMVSTIGTFATQALAGPVVVRLDWTGFYVMLALAAVLGVVVLGLATRRVTAVAIAGGGPPVRGKRCRPMKSAACWGFCCLRCSAWCSMWAAVRWAVRWCFSRRTSSIGDCSAGRYRLPCSCRCSRWAWSPWPCRSPRCGVAWKIGARRSRHQRRSRSASHSLPRPSCCSALLHGA